MFGWKIPKSADAVIPEWVKKRALKLALKKLEQFIVGGIDLDQLDVQLSQGSVQLSNLALNLDFLNDKLGGVAPLIIKEGSIGSLLVKILWGRELQVVVDEVEILLAFRTDRSYPSGEKTDDLGQAGNHDVQSEAGKLGGCTTDGAAKSSSANVHEGVKMIAKIVKWLLSSFRVKVNRLLIAFEPLCSKEEDIRAGFQRILVLRISEMECGTRVSEDANLNSDSRVESILGSRLTNFVMFHGVVLELLEMRSIENQTCSPCASGSIFSESFPDIRSSSTTSRIVSGGNDGFSGSLKLSIPWKNGSLDIRKLHADICIDPIELILRPGAIKWLLHAWETYQNLDKDAVNVMNYELMDSVYCNSASCFYSSTNFHNPSDRMIPVHGDSLSSLSSLNGQQSSIEGLISGSHLIHDWVPNSVEQTGEGNIEELDLGASVDQFFECFDGIRNSQSVLGSSGMWNWTCSVFSALTAASSLASGSLRVPSEQQHVQTNLKASVVGFSVILFFQDEEENRWHDQIIFGSSAQCLVADCKGIFIALQVHPRDLSFEGTVRYIEVTEYFCHGNDVMKPNLSENSSNIINQTVEIQHLQAEIQDALPPCSFSKIDPGSDELDSLVVSYFPLQNAVKFKLFSTNGATHCLFSTSSGLSDGSLKGPSSLSVQIPPFVFWVNFYLVTMLLEVVKDIGNTVEVKNRTARSPTMNEKPGPCHGDAEKSPLGAVKSSSVENFRCNVFVPSGRVILCFPSTSGKDVGVGGYFSWNQFVALDIFAPEKQKFQDIRTIEASTLLKRYACRATHSLHVHVSDLRVHLVIASDKGSGLLQRMFTSKEILSISDKAGCFSTVSMLWNEGTLSGPWIADKAKCLFTSEESWGRRKSMGYEFATVTSAKDLEDIHFQRQEDIILSSAFFVHINLFPVAIDLSRSQYAELHSILDQMVNVLSIVGCDTASIEEASSTSQSSILVECKSLEMLIRTDVRKDVKGSLQTELPGSWHCLKLNVQRLNLLSVSNIGVSSGASFFRLAHGEGKLWGCISDIAEREFLLISCSKSMRSRGDGRGSNALSSRSAGLDIMHLWDPNSLHDFTSITVRCSTLVAVGGRLDWLDAISSFFILPSPENVEAIDNNSPKLDLRTSFVLKFVDVGLSYEPYMKDSVVKDLRSSCIPAQDRENNNESCVTSLLAASSLTLSNRHAGDSLDNDYVIRVQDLGLLLCLAHHNIGGNYSVEYLHEMGYVKVAWVPLVEATFRINCKNGLLWEVECTKSQICLETRHDTTTGLIQLAAQLQQLFAPDLEESIVHLQNRWNNVHHFQERTESTDESMDHSHDSSLSAPQVHVSYVDAEMNPGVSGLMDEIREDAFHLDGNQAYQFDSDESDVHIHTGDSFAEGPSGLGMGESDVCPGDSSKYGSVALLELDSSQTSFTHDGSFPAFIESYCLSELRPLSELSLLDQPSCELLKGRQRIYGEGDLGRGDGGWYGDVSLNIIEDHISEASTDSIRFLDEKISSMDSGIPDENGQATGHIICRNMKVSWKMYAGSDWSECKNNGNPSISTCERDVNACLELSISGMQFEYDSFPVGGICTSKLCLSIQDFFLYDRSKAAPWKRILGYYRSKDRPRETASKAFRLVLESVRPDPSIPLEEYRLRIAFLPMLLHLQQCQLDFLICFFGGKSSSLNSSGDQLGIPNPSVSNTSDFVGNKIIDEALLPYFQKFDILPILLRVDYQPQNVDLAALRGGKYVELVNLVPWKGVELQLKHVQAVGIYGWGSVCETIVGEWLEDISQNQIRKVLQGLPTIRSLVAVGAGATKLFSLPIESYRKDRKVIKGMQRGTIAFLRSISIEAVGLGVHLAAGAHDILLQAEYILTNVPPSVSWPAQGKIKPNIRCNQPKDAQHGMKKAYESLSDGLGKSATALLRKPLKKYQRGASAGSALATAVRAVPAAAIGPVSACVNAAHYALLGIRNSLDPEHKKESLEKYMGSTQPPDRD